MQSDAAAAPAASFDPKKEADFPPFLLPTGGLPPAPASSGSGGGVTWIRARDLAHVQSVWDAHLGSGAASIVCGNTGVGIYRDLHPPPHHPAAAPAPAVPAAAAAAASKSAAPAGRVLI